MAVTAKDREIAPSATPKVTRVQKLLGIADLVVGSGEYIYNNPQVYDAIQEGALFRRFNLARGIADVVEHIAQIPKGGRIADVASGTGIITHELTNRGYEVLPFDQSQRFLNSLHERVGDESGRRVHRIGAADMNDRWPLEDRSVDAVVQVRATRYVENFDQWLTEAKRVLKDDGVLVLPVFALDIPFIKRRGVRQPTLARSIARELEKAGFTVEALVPYGEVIKAFGEDRRIPKVYYPKTIVARKNS